MRAIPSSPPDDRIPATTRWLSRLVVPVLVAAFVVLYVFPDRTMQLWSWMVCPEMSALVMGSGYLAGAYFFTRAACTREWHRVSVGFVATTVFSTILLAATILHWSQFNHDHVSFWAWLALYVATPFLLPILWVENQRTDPRRVGPSDITVPWALRVAVGIGGAVQLAFAFVLFVWPATVAEMWPWGIDPMTGRALSAFVAFPAVTWFMFLFEGRWSSFRITQHTATIGLALITLGALRAGGGFLSDSGYALYLAALVVALVLNLSLYAAMESRTSKTKERGNHAESPPSPVIGARVGGECRLDRPRRRVGAGVGQT
ncbi:MAG: hypothetical protein M3179_14320 [Actinomycetota bacterium]|nr:hypothetical protein [Actinomycetota bacterium]